MTRKRRTPEEDLQRAAVQLLDGLGWMFFHSPNGGRRTQAEAAIFAGLGVKKGVADILILERWSAPPAHGSGIAIELKSATGTLTRHQREWLEQASRRGWLTAMCRSVDEVLYVLQFAQPLNGRMPMAAISRQTADPRQIDWTGGGR